MILPESGIWIEGRAIVSRPEKERSSVDQHHRRDA